MSRHRVPHRYAQRHECEVCECECEHQRRNRSSTQPAHVASSADKMQWDKRTKDPEYVNHSVVLENSPCSPCAARKRQTTSSDKQTLSAVSGPSQALPHNEINQPTRVIVIGNPGVGKSTIQNTLVKEHVFKSGISLGGGLTKSTAMFTRGELTFVDTPGLDDVYNRKTAAREITAALRGPGPIKVIFVTALEAGRVRPADVCTLHTFVKALREVVGDMRNRYALIINKCEESIAQKLRNKDCRDLRESVLGPFLAVEMVRQVEVIGLETRLQGKSRTLLSMQAREKLQSIVERTPTIHVPSEPVVRLDVENFEETARIMEEVGQFKKAVVQGEKSGSSRVSGNRQRVVNYPQHLGKGHEENLQKLKARMDRYSNRTGGGSRSRLAEFLDAVFNIHIG